jgi:hypothetical protein
MAEVPRSTDQRALVALLQVTDDPMLQPSVELDSVVAYTRELQHVPPMGSYAAIRIAPAAFGLGTFSGFVLVNIGLPQKKAGFFVEGLWVESAGPIIFSLGPTSLINANITSINWGPPYSFDFPENQVPPSIALSTGTAPAVAVAPQWALAGPRNLITDAMGGKRLWIPQGYALEGLHNTANTAWNGSITISWGPDI